MSNDIRKYIDLITEVARMDYHSSMPIKVMQTAEFKAQLKELSTTNTDLANLVLDAMGEIVRYYAWKSSSMKGKFKRSGNSGKSKNFTQLDNHVYHYHIGGDNKTNKKGKEVSNNILEVQIFELPDENDVEHLVILFFSVSTHGFGRWNIDGVVELSNIKQISDLHGKVDRVKQNLQSGSK